MKTFPLLSFSGETHGRLHRLLHDPPRPDAGGQSAADPRLHPALPDGHLSPVRPLPHAKDAPPEVGVRWCASRSLLRGLRPHLAVDRSEIAPSALGRQRTDQDLQHSAV